MIRLTFGVGFLLAAFLAAAQDLTLVSQPVTMVKYNGSIEDIEDHVDQYGVTIAHLQAQIDAEKSTFLARLSVLDAQIEITKQKVGDVFETGILDVECNGIKFPELDAKPALVELVKCVTKARDDEQSLFQTCNSDVEALARYYVQLSQELPEICRQHTKNSGFVVYATCMTDAIGAEISYTQSMHQSFGTNIRNLKSALDDRITETIDCTVKNTYNITAIITQLEQRVKQCRSSEELLKPCPASCPLAINLTNELIFDFRSIIENLFHGLTEPDCVKINFFPHN